MPPSPNIPWQVAHLDWKICLPLFIMLGSSIRLTRVCLGDLTQGQQLLGLLVEEGDHLGVVAVDRQQSRTEVEVEDVERRGDDADPEQRPPTSAAAGCRTPGCRRRSGPGGDRRRFARHPWCARCRSLGRSPVGVGVDFVVVERQVAQVLPASSSCAEKTQATIPVKVTKLMTRPTSAQELSPAAPMMSDEAHSGLRGLGPRPSHRGRFPAADFGRRWRGLRPGDVGAEALQVGDQGHDLLVLEPRRAALLERPRRRSAGPAQWRSSMAPAISSIGVGHAQRAVGPHRPRDLLEIEVRASSIQG